MVTFSSFVWALGFLYKSPYRCKLLLAMTEVEQKFWIIEREAKMKTERLYKAGSLVGHITAWKRLCLVWKKSRKSRLELRALGFDFSQEKFAENNGTEGKLPVLPSEFKQIGLHTVHSNFRRENSITQ